MTLWNLKNVPRSLQLAIGYSKHNLADVEPVMNSFLYAHVVLFMLVQLCMELKLFRMFWYGLLRVCFTLHMYCLLTHATALHPKRILGSWCKKANTHILRLQLSSAPTSRK